MSFHVWVDVNQIQAYVFGTNKLRTIVGASALLDRLNRDDAEALIAQHGGQPVVLGGGVVPRWRRWLGPKERTHGARTPVV